MLDGALEKSPGFAEHPDHRIKIDPSPKRVRAMISNTVVLDTVGAKLVRETGHMPIYYFPREDALHIEAVPRLS